MLLLQIIEVTSLTLTFRDQVTIGFPIGH